MRDIFVDLPNGTREFLSPEIDFISYDEADVYVINEIHPFVKEAVEFGIKQPEHLDFYMDRRRSVEKNTHDIGSFVETFCHFFDYPYASRLNSAQLLEYMKMRFSGESHTMSELLASRSFPGIKTDAIFNEGRFSGEAGRIGMEQRWLQEQAEAVGVSTTGKFYCRGLADFPGDPTAWVSDRGDVLRVAREKNMTVHGYVEHEGRQVEPAADVRIADDLVEGEVNEIMAECPGADREMVREEVFAVRTGGVDPNDLRVGDYDESYLQPEA